MRNRKVVILGLARQGLALARAFARQGADVTVSDLAGAEELQHEMAALAGLPVKLVLGGHPLSLLDGCDLLCLSGGVPPQIEIVATAVASGIRLSNDSLLTLGLARSRGLGPLVGITGSSGKTTTTTLVGLMLAASGQTAHVGGNIGTPLIDRLDGVDAGEPLVLELSSFQLELFDPVLAYGPIAGIGPDVGAILNLTPNHLDRHPNMAAYAAAKLNLVGSLPAGAALIVSADDPVTGTLAQVVEPWLTIEAPPAEWSLDRLLADAGALVSERGLSVTPFSRRQPLGKGAWLAGEALVLDGRPFCTRHEILLRGEHNISNLLAAAAIAGAAGAEHAALGEVARTFAGVPHRLEVVAGGEVTWINDSIATSPERALAALRSFEPGAQTLIMLAGGKDKRLPWGALVDEVLNRVDLLIGFGDAGPMIVESVRERSREARRPAPNCAVVQRLDEAVSLAAAAAAPRTIVLLSPGGTSFDAYRNFEERGEHFRKLVHRHTESWERGNVGTWER